jgi:two-component system, LuxR family, sensor kinase FixL
MLGQWTTAIDQNLPTSRSFQILIIEDDADTCANLTDILELDGYRVTTVGTARETRALQNWSEISAIILDRRLPDADADNLLPQLRELAPHCPVIVVTGYGDLQGAIAALRNGASDYILKPVNPDVLRASIARLVENQRLEVELSRSQSQLRQQRDFVESLLETVPTAVLLLDAEGNILRFNSYLEQLCEYPLEDVRGHNFFEIFLPEYDRERVRTLLLGLIEHSRIAEFETIVISRTGKEATVRWSATVLGRSQETVIGVLASGQDVTELKLAQYRVLQHERLAAIGQAMTGLVHESRNALQRCRACLEMLSVEMADRPDALNLLDRMQSAQNDLHQLFEEVREYASPIKLDRKVCDIADIWRQAWHDLSHLHKEKNIKLTESVVAVNVRCGVDPFALRQVLRNILENAIQASPKEEQICIACQEITHGDRDELQIAVSDHGPGVPAALRLRILEPFFTTKTKGTGLGLAIAERIVRSHGGLIKVSENQPSGTRMLISLPKGSL